MSYPCTGCGLCCMSAGKAVDGAKKLLQQGNDNPYIREVASFPYSYDSNGRCSMLDENKKCAVYDNRPDICKIDVTWKKYHSEGMSLGSYYLSTMKVCNDMMENAGNYDNFFIELPDGEL